MTAAPRRAGDTNYHYHTNIGDPTGGLPHWRDSGHCDRVVQNSLVVQRATTCSSSRIKSTPHGGGGRPAGRNASRPAFRGAQKRRAPENEGPALTLETIREAIGEAIRGELQEVRQDIRHFATRVDHVESQVTKQMQQTINRDDP